MSSLSSNTSGILISHSLPGRSTKAENALKTGKIIPSGTSAPSPFSRANAGSLVRRKPDEISIAHKSSRRVRRYRESTDKPQTSRHLHAKHQQVLERALDISSSDCT